MKRNLCLMLIVILLLVGSNNVNASSGRLKKDSIRTCNGIMYGRHSDDNHWHVAEKKGDWYYPIGEPIYSDPCTFDNSLSSTDDLNNENDFTNNSSSSDNLTNDDSSNNDVSKIEPVSENDSLSKEKSHDNTLKTIIIDGKEIDIMDNIDYSTTKEKITVEVTPNDEKAKYEIKNNTNLKIGQNKVLIEVIAEDETSKVYTINIEREKILSSDTGIKIIIDEDVIKFNNNEATVYADYDTENVKIDYTLNDKNAKVEMNKLENLNFGDNELKIKVIAEDGTEQEYKIIVHRYTKAEETISTIIGFSMVGGAGYGVYHLIKKKSKLKIKK